MKIEDKRQDKMFLSYLDFGICFEYQNRKCIKMKSNKNDIDGMCHCFCIDTSEEVWIDYEREVLPLNAKVVIE